LDSNNDFLYSICEDLEIQGEKGSKADYLNRLNNFLMDCYTKGVNVVLIIDEAQALSPQLLEEVRLLTNLETPDRKLLQVILVGQPELNNTLEQPRFRPLKQRISVRFHLQPLNPRELKEYIKRRLRVAGARSPYLFSPKALKRIYQYSGGIPRLINIVCDNALINGYAGEQRVIGDDIIQEVVSDLAGSPPRKFFHQSRKIIFFSGLAVALLLFIGTLPLWEPGNVFEVLKDLWARALGHLKAF
jgi:general secretion pathway protein A